MSDEELRYCDPVTFAELQALSRENALLKEMVDLLSEVYYLQDTERIKEVGKLLDAF